MTQTILIWRRATVRDVPALLDLQDSAFTEIGGAHYPMASIRHALNTVTMLSADLIAEGNYFVLEQPGGSIAAGGGWSQVRPGYATALAEPDSMPATQAIVRCVYVNPDFARRGLGRAVMDHIEADARAHGIRCLTLTSTLPGLPLYRRMGYTHHGPETADIGQGLSLEVHRMSKCIASDNEAAA